MGNNMVYVLFDTKGNVKTFKMERKLEEFLKRHEGIYYLVGVSGRWINVARIRAEKGDWYQVDGGFIEFKD